MPIRFRCAYCNQLMGIAHRKAGTVVRCPKCDGQVVVPAQSEKGAAPTMPASPTAPSATTPSSVFEFEDLGGILKTPMKPARPTTPMPSEGSSDEMIDVVPLFGPGQVRGLFLTSRHLLLAGLGIIVLLVGAFFLGWFLGKR